MDKTNMSVSPTQEGFAMGQSPLKAEAEAVPKHLVNFLRRICGMTPGRSYAITLWLPEDSGSEPVWSIKDLGKIENQR